MSAYSHLDELRAVINNFKDMFEITGEIDFGFKSPKDEEQNLDKNMMKLGDFVDLTNNMFNQIL